MASKVPLEPFSLIHLQSHFQRTFTVTKTELRGANPSMFNPNRTKQEYLLTAEYAHEYTILVFQEEQHFNSVMYSRLLKANSIISVWKYSQSFNQLPAALQLAQDMILKPHEYGSRNLNRGLTADWSGAKDMQVASRLSHYERPAGLDDGSLVDRVSRGRQDFTVSLAGGELVRQLWFRRSQSARAALVLYAQAAPFDYGYWTHWKWLADAGCQYPL